MAWTVRPEFPESKFTTYLCPPESPASTAVIPGIEIHYVSKEAGKNFLARMADISEIGHRYARKPAESVRPGIPDPPNRK